MIMDYSQDNRIVLTLDAGGTNFVFSAIQANREIIAPITCPSYACNLDLCLSTIIEGFKAVVKLLESKPVAISFAFPGPADYPNGIIGDLSNLPAFKGGVALGSMLREIFDLPAYINNDGDLFAYGEYIGGFIPWVNKQLKDSGSPKQYGNLLGVTLGTGFGAGIVRNGELFLGDNSSSAEIWLIRHKTMNRCFAEEGISIRAIQRVYLENTTVTPPEKLTPKDIFNIAKGRLKGDKKAAMKAFTNMAVVLGDALANAITLIDGLIVIGGGLSASYELLADAIVDEMNGKIETYEGESIPRLVQKVYNLHDKNQLSLFISGHKKEIDVPGSKTKLIFDPEKRTGIGLSRLGTSQAINLGAYSFALNELDKKRSNP
jgi:glucokinase